MTDPDVRRRQPLDSYRRALARPEQAVILAGQRPLSDLEKQGVIQGFEFTHELAGSLVRDYFLFQGVTTLMGSRDATREAFSKGLVSDGQTWMAMIRSRNQTSRAYNPEVAEAICQRIITSYFPLFKELERRMEALV